MAHTGARDDYLWPVDFLYVFGLFTGARGRKKWEAEDIVPVRDFLLHLLFEILLPPLPIDVSDRNRKRRIEEYRNLAHFPARKEHAYFVEHKLRALYRECRHKYGATSGNCLCQYFLKLIEPMRLLRVLAIAIHALYKHDVRIRYGFSVRQEEGRGVPQVACDGKGGAVRTLHPYACRTEDMAGITQVH